MAPDWEGGQTIELTPIPGTRRGSPTRRGWVGCASCRGSAFAVAIAQETCLTQAESCSRSTHHHDCPLVSLRWLNTAVGGLVPAPAGLSYSFS